MNKNFELKSFKDKVAFNLNLIKLTMLVDKELAMKMLDEFIEELERDKNESE
ncbi:hypothetical protein [Mesobacillus maritimus]|uniref:hypothetical protein n=1 Tax=Mesobacillus maritimus TaxID=1643336 RepID=UPI00384B88F2